MDSKTFQHDVEKLEACQDARDGQDQASKATKFEPIDRQNSASDVQIPEQTWLTILETHCTFPPDLFHEVMLSLVKNPNITSSYLFRADIFYDSGPAEPLPRSLGPSKLLQYLKPEYRPRNASVPGYELARTIVRQLVPRNPQLDQPLVQTCQFFHAVNNEEVERHLVIFVPHADSADQIPFYHPTVCSLAFLHVWPVSFASRDATLSISYRLFSGDTTPTLKLYRTALRLLQTIHKHGQGQLAGYSKRVHHDQIIPQKRYQDTYTRLKAKYGRRLAEQWVEVTEPGKHVFEDLGIAAFLIELWRGMYRMPSGETMAEAEDAKQEFPGFVDIGCGNGILVHILLSEGYAGSGFDARERKTWSVLPPSTRERLHVRLLVPEILPSALSSASASSTLLDPQATPGESIERLHHPGIFPKGTFIISNHADELTTWTPLLAYLNSPTCPFIAVPCCSHDLSGARFRAPLTRKAAIAKSTASPSPSPGPSAAIPQRLPQQPRGVFSTTSIATTTGPKAAAETGSLKPTAAQKKLPSAYASLCAYVTSLAEELGFQVEKEVLRIPSTRNLCIVGRARVRKRNPGETEGYSVVDGEEEEQKVKRQRVRELVEREMGRRVEVVGREWIARAEGLGKKNGSGH